MARCCWRRSGLLDGRVGEVSLGLCGSLPSKFSRCALIPEPGISFLQISETGHVRYCGRSNLLARLAIHSHLTVTVVRGKHCTSPRCIFCNGMARASCLMRALSGVGHMQNSIVRQAEDWLRKHFHEPRAVAAVVAECGIPERSLKRRFKTATGSTVMAMCKSSYRGGKAAARNQRQFV